MNLIQVKFETLQIVRTITKSGTTANVRREERAQSGLSKLHIEPRSSLEVVDWIVLDNWYADLKRYCEILAQAPPHAEIERQE